MSDSIPFTRATNRGIELEFTAVPDATLDILLGWPDGTAKWQDHQVRTIIGVLGDGVRDVAYGAVVHVRRQVLPRPLGHLLWFDRVFGVRYSWPSCLVWVPVETAAVLAADVEPIDIEAVKVHTRVRQGLPLRVPDVAFPSLRVPKLDGFQFSPGMLTELRGLDEHAAQLQSLDGALAGVMDRLQAALPEGIALRPEMVDFGSDDILSNDTTVRLVPEAVEAEMARRAEEQRARIERLFPDL